MGAAINTSYDVLSDSEKSASTTDRWRSKKQYQRKVETQCGGKLYEKGRGLPLKAKAEYRTIRLVRRGESDIMRIPAIEGEQMVANRNCWIGELEVKGEKIARDLPVGSEIEVTLQVDESRIVTVKAYVPVLEEEFKTVLVVRAHNRDMEALRRDYEAEMARFEEVKSKAGVAGGHAAKELIRKTEESAVLEEVRDPLLRMVIQMLRRNVIDGCWSSR